MNTIRYYDEEFLPLATITVTKQVSEHWTPTPNFLNARAIQAVQDGKIIAVASKTHNQWHYNLVGGPSTLTDNDSTHTESVVVITRYFSHELTKDVTQC